MRFFRNTIGLILGQWVFVRNERAGVLLENFLISTVFAILFVRLYIRLFAGTPVTTQLTIRVATPSTTADLHIAHVLWGGLIMLVALILALTFLSRSARELTAILGGIGFGVFIDELGKFITRDNDYFFQPTIALIYLTIVLLFIITRFFQRPRPLSEREALANALEIAKLSAISDASPEDRAHALRLLEQNHSSPSPVTNMVRQLLQYEEASHRRPNPLDRAKMLLGRLYQRLAGTWWFPNFVVAIFVFQSVGSLYETLTNVGWTETLGIALGASLLAVVVLSFSRGRSSYLRVLGSLGIILAAMAVALLILTYQREIPEPLSYWLKQVASDVEPGTGFLDRFIHMIEVLGITSPVISNVLVVFGILTIWRSRLTAYHLFYYAILVSILLTQFFVFIEDQIIGVVGLLPNLLILVTLRYLIRQEEAASESLVVQSTVPQGSREPVGSQSEGQQSN